MQFQNPIIRGFHPDPSVCVVGEDYYLVTSSFEYLPGVPLFHSRDLVHWEQIGHCLTRESQIDLAGSRCSGGIFAPTLRYHEGRFYMITTNIAKGNFFVTADDICGEWSEPVWVDVMGIDPSLFWEDGKTYMQLSSRDEKGCVILQCEIDTVSGEILNGPREISRGCGGRDAEAPHLYYKDGYYYLLLAEGGTREGHMVTVSRSRSIWGPFEPCPHNPVLSNRDCGQEPLQCVGHADLFCDRFGTWWMAALAVRPVKHRHTLGRETVLVPAVWTREQWPAARDGYAALTVKVEGRDAICEEVCQTLTNIPAVDDFNGEKLLPCYNFMRSFLRGQYRLETGKCYLKGNRYSLNDLESPAFVARVLEDYRFTLETLVSFSPKSEEEEAGLALYMDTAHHMDFVVTLRNGKRVVLLRKNVSDIKVEEGIRELPEQAESIRLTIRGDETWYTFFGQIGQEEPVCVGRTVISHLATECADSAFTGVYGGMYVFGEGTEAVYDYLRLESN